MNKREKKALVKVLLGFFFLSSLALGFFPGCSLHSCYQTRQQADALAAANRKLLQETVALSREIDLLENDPQHVERIAREKYGMLKKDEEVYYINKPAGKKKEDMPPELELEPAMR